MAEGITDFVITDHAVFEMTRRHIAVEHVRSVVSSPEQRLEIRTGRVLLQSRRELVPGGEQYLVRVIVDVDREPAEVVTAYATSKIIKYWRTES